MFASVFRGWRRRNSIKTDRARHSATSELHLQDQDLNRSISCPGPPGPPDGESPLMFLLTVLHLRQEASCDSVQGPVPSETLRILKRGPCEC
ncbi:hypothetical protein OYC64_016213 [Pagothenia borchgrevinki]|uniref:Uncharacterized protein n=1 Tax=Pagothenia borchgrevinki TaxID=8213 RepID=A0ABD2HID2_PAGBO